MNDLSILQLILEATLIVQAVMLMLVLASVYSWSIIFKKRAVLGRAKDDLARFEKDFWSGGDLSQLYKSIESRGNPVGIDSIFRTGFREFARLRQQGENAVDLLIEGARRAMKAQQIKEIEYLEKSLSTLATVGSTSPYVGLFGTVWGIMHAFVGLSQLQQVSLDSVAPGIAEALVATAIGLFAAIPAVIAYNRFARDIDRIAIHLESFIEEFSNILQRNAGAQVG